MLSKIIVSLIVFGFLVISPRVNAHPPHTDISSNATPIIIGWTWQAGHFVYPSIWIRGHWFHPNHGKSYRAHRHGPPPIHIHAQPLKHKHQPRHYNRNHKRR